MVLLVAVMFRVVALGEVMVAEPDSTCAPWGSAKAALINILADKRNVNDLKYFKRDLLENARVISKSIGALRFWLCCEGLLDKWRRVFFGS